MWPRLPGEFSLGPASWRDTYRCGSKWRRRLSLVLLLAPREPPLPWTQAGSRLEPREGMWAGLVGGAWSRRERLGQSAAAGPDWSGERPGSWTGIRWEVPKATLRVRW